MFPLSITKEEIDKMPMLTFKGQIHLVENHTQLEKAYDDLSQQDFLGFDAEKKPTFVKGQYHHTALIQLSTAHDAYLFMVHKTGITKPLQHILESENIQKIGIGIKDDLVDLKMLGSIFPDGFIDLNTLASQSGVKNVGVKNLAAIFLGKRVSKGQQTSNWENDPLTSAQIEYAAIDAWVCREIYMIMLSQGLI